MTRRIKSTYGEEKQWQAEIEMTITGRMRGKLNRRRSVDLMMRGENETLSLRVEISAEMRR